MNMRLVAWLLGIIVLLLGASMGFGIPWGISVSGGEWIVERSGVVGLLMSMVVCGGVGSGLLMLGQKAKGMLFRKEAIAVVGLSWMLATVCGGLPYYFGKVERAAGVPMSFIDSCFESQSGFSTTGATVLSDVENVEMIPRCLLFWRSMTHFLGGMGIMVLFVAVLGQGMAGKAMMRAEMTGVRSANAPVRMRQTAMMVCSVYIGLNVMAFGCLWWEGLSVFDAICHAFSTIATGGFSTYNASIGHFAGESVLRADWIEWTLVVFMFLGGTSFVLIYMAVCGDWRRWFGDTEWKVYLGMIVVAAGLISMFGCVNSDFVRVGNDGGEMTGVEDVVWYDAVRVSVFHVVSMMTTTGFCTVEFEKWNGFSCWVILLLMVVGGCAGSTAGGIKVIRIVIGWKVIKQAVVSSFHPNLVCSLRVSGKVVERETAYAVLVYFLLFMMIFILSILLVLAVEPDRHWVDAGMEGENRVVDVGSCVLSTLGNIGPGLGIIGARQNYGGFAEWTKCYFIFLMMLGRLELFAVLALFHPAFWRKHL